MPRTTVFLIREGQFLGMKAESGDYDSWMNIVRRLLEGSVIVRSVSSWSEAITGVVNDGLGMENSVVVFFTRGMFKRAQEVKQKYPTLQVVVLTANLNGLPKDSGVVVIGKTGFDRDVVSKAMLA